MKNKKTKLGLLVLGTSVIGATSIALIASQPQTEIVEQASITKPQLASGEALNELTEQTTSTSPGNSLVENSGLVVASPEMVGNYLAEYNADAPTPQTGARVQLHLPDDFQTLHIQNCWHEQGVWEIHFHNGDEIVEVIGSFEEETPNQMKVASLKIRELEIDDVEVELNGWKVTLLKKSTTWYFNVAKGEVDTAFEVAPEFAGEMKGQLANDFDVDVGDEVNEVADEVAPVEPIEPLSWRERFGFSGLANSEAPRLVIPKYTFPKVKPVEVYQAPKIEVPAPELSFFSTSFSSGKFGSWLDDEPVTVSGPQLPETFSSLEAFNIYKEDDFFHFEFEKNQIHYEVLGYLAPGGTSKMKVVELKIDNRAVYSNGWTIVLYERIGKLGFDFTKKNIHGAVNSEEHFHSIEEGITWVNLITYTPRLAGDDPARVVNARNWNYETDTLTDRELSRNKINLRNREGEIYIRKINKIDYHLEYASDVIGSETYRIFITRKGTKYPIYLNPETGAEIKQSQEQNGNPEGEEFEDGSHGKVYEIARKHQTQQNV